MMKTKDDLLREAIEQTGYYISKDITVTLNDKCDLSYINQIALLLAREVVRFRPDLTVNKEKDVVYIICFSDGNYSLPTNDLTTLLETQKPFADDYITSYSLSKKKILSKLYKGDGVKWIPCMGR